MDYDYCGDFEDGGVTISGNDYEDTFDNHTDSSSRADMVVEGTGLIKATTRATAEPLEVREFELSPLQLVNTMASFTLDTDVDLRQLVISCRNVEYNPRKLNAATIRFQKPRLAATVFACGRVSLCGRATIEEVKYYARFVALLAKKCGHVDARCMNLKIDSLGFAGSCGFPIRLENLAADHVKYCNYEPDIYCGLVYRYQISEKFKATALIYVSGRILITGCRKPSQAYEVYKNLYNVLYLYRA